MKIFFIIIFLLTLCTTVAVAQPLYKNISGDKVNQDGRLVMAEAYCRNVVNSHVTPYEGPSGYYASSRAGGALNRGLNRIGQAMSGPNYNDCMLSQGFQFVGNE